MKEQENLFLEIPGTPVGKGRPRFTKQGRAYTPKKTAQYENLMRLAFVQKYPDWLPTEDPVQVYIRAEYSLPASWTKRRKLLALLTSGWKITKPDLDNIMKTLDGLNGVAWKDDSQIVHLSALKYYGPRPALSVHIVVDHEARTLEQLSTAELEARWKERCRAEHEEETEEEDNG